MSKVRKQSTLSKLQEQFQELRFLQWYYAFFLPFHWAAYFYKLGNQRLAYKLVDYAILIRLTIKVRNSEHDAEIVI